MAKAHDLDKFFRIPADFRDLNYSKYVQENAPEQLGDEYNSHNTKRLNVQELKELLLTLDYVQDELKNYQGQ